MDDSSTRPNIETRRHPLSDADCRRIYDIHSRSLPDDVMPNFGYDVERNYLDALSQESGAVIVARVDQEIVGFVLLRFTAVNMIKFLSPGAMLEFLSSSRERPKILVRLILQLLKAQPNPAGSAEVDYFAVDARFRGRGVGEALLEEAERQTLQHGLNRIFTKTNNERLRKYYADEKNAKSVFRFTILKDVYYGVVWEVGPQ